MFQMKESGKREDRTILILAPAQKWPQFRGKGHHFLQYPPPHTHSSVILQISFLGLPNILARKR